MAFFFRELHSGASFRKEDPVESYYTQSSRDPGAVRLKKETPTEERQEDVNTMLGIVVKGHRRKVGQGTGTEYDFHEEEQTIYVTPAQMAGLIVVFFAEIASPKTIYHALLGRLLKKRWAVMSLNSEKDLYRSRLEGVLIPPYDKVSS